MWKLMMVAGLLFGKAVVVTAKKHYRENTSNREQSVEIPFRTRRIYHSRITKRRNRSIHDGH